MSSAVKKLCSEMVFVLSILSILALDQYTKLWIRLRLTQGESIPIITNTLHITFVQNTGAAFGLFKNATIVFIIISISAIFFISILIINAIKKGGFFIKPVFNSGLILIISGAIGNLLDRLRFGYVIDFIDVRIWPVFNIADSSVTIGTILLLFSFLSRSK